MSKPFPVEFRRDVDLVARKREAALSQIAKDFGISDACLHNWLKRADVEESITSGVMEKDAGRVSESTRRSGQSGVICPTFFRHLSDI